MSAAVPPPPADLPPELLARLLARWPAATLAVARPGRSPWAVPVVFAPAHERLWSPVDGKPKRSGPPARLAHLAREGAATLLLDHYAADWTALWWVRLEVSARLCRLAEDDPYRHPGARALVAKYPQYRSGTGSTALFAGEPILVEMRITGIRAWAAAGLAALGAQFS